MNLDLKLYAAIAAILLYVAIGFAGIQHGKNVQKEADDLATALKVQADTAAINKATNDARSKEQAVATLKDQLEKLYAQQQSETESLRRQLTSQRLRFAAASCGDSTGNVPSVTGTTLLATTSVCELSAEADAALKAIAHDADKLRDDYAKCYGYAVGLPKAMGAP